MDLEKIGVNLYRIGIVVFCGLLVLALLIGMATIIIELIINFTWYSIPVSIGLISLMFIIVGVIIETEFDNNH